jgi:hypothetical protein
MEADERAAAVVDRWRLVAAERAGEPVELA